MDEAYASPASTAHGSEPDSSTKESRRGPTGRLELSHEHALWLETVRKLPVEIAAEMGIVSWGRAVVFEYRRRGQLLWRQVRFARKGGDKTFACYAPDGRTIKEAGIELSFWNEDDLQTDPSLPDAPLIITEGQFDAAAFKLARAPRVVSVPNGAVDRMSEKEIIAEEDRQFAYLWRINEAEECWSLVPGLNTAKQVILATDDDKAGRVLRDELAVRIGLDRCWYVTYPKGCKDANEALQKFGPEKGCDLLIEALASAKPMVPSQLVKLSDVPRKKREAVTSGWRDLDPHLKIVRPEFMIITGPPNHGKTQFALALGANLARHHGWPGAFLQGEDDVERTREDLTRHWLSANRPDKVPDLELCEDDWQAAAPWLDRMFRIVSPSVAIDDSARDLSWLRRTIKEASTRHGARWIVIDPWNELEHIWARNQTEAHYLNEALRGLNRLARLYQIVLIIVAHPDKESGRETKIEQWSLYSMSGGQAWNNKADHGVVVFRPDAGQAECLIKISKSRDQKLMGRQGVVRMRFRPRLANFEFVSRVE